MRRFHNEAGISLVLPSRKELDLTDQAEVGGCYTAEQPDAVIVDAGKVGGIHANRTYPAQFIHQKIAIATNCIDGAWKAGVQRPLFLGSSCSYPQWLRSRYKRSTC